MSILTEKNFGYGIRNIGDEAATESPVGYRSRSVANVGGGFTGSSVSRVVYNGFEFPPTLHAGVTIVNEYDDLGKGLKFLTIALTIDCVITPEFIYESDYTDISTYQNTDTMMEIVRERLAQPGQTLILESKGLGNLNINTGRTIDFVDVDYGPKPQVMELKPIAGERALALTWLVTTRIPACRNVAVNNGILQSYNSVGWTTSSEGITTRTVKGKIEQVKTRIPSYSVDNEVASSSVFNSVALFAELIRILSIYPAIGGYKRTITY